MSRVDRHLEKLIVRHLDGALSEDEELELNRALIRNPDARRMMDDYRRIDEVAGAALHRALDTGPVPFDPAALPPRRDPKPRRRFARGWWLASGAVAAALLAVLVARVPLTPSAGPTIAQHDTTAPPPRSVPVFSESAPRDRLMHNVAAGRPSIRRKTDRGVFGVIGEDGNIYWIEVDRTRTIRRPLDRAAWNEM